MSLSGQVARRGTQQRCGRATNRLENGALCAGPDGMTHVPAFAVQPVDTTGAGDAFIGSLACFLAEGMAEMDAIARANLYAALSTLGAGTQKSFVTRERFDAEWLLRLNVS